jgi:hypothetical protein
MELLHLTAERRGPLPGGHPDWPRLTNGNDTCIWLIEQAVGLQNRGRKLSCERIGAWHHHCVLGVIEKAVRVRWAHTRWVSHG